MQEKSTQQHAQLQELQSLQSNVSSLSGGNEDCFSMDKPGKVKNSASSFVVHETQLTDSDAVDFNGIILLDNQSSTTVMREPLNGLVRDIKSTQDMLRIHTNAGTATTNQKAKVLQFDSWCHPNGTASIISQAHAVDHPDCEVDHVKASKKGAKDDHCILTHVPTQTKRHFNRHGNHCIWYPSKEEASPATQFVETVKENMSKFSQRQISGATKVRNLLKSLMLPSVKDLKKIIQFNLIKNNPCTLEDVRVAELILQWVP